MIIMDTKKEPKGVACVVIEWLREGVDGGLGRLGMFFL
jgi:hypothetical protein